MNERGMSGAVARLGELLTRDRASRLDPYVKWVRKPTAVLALATATAVLCGLYLHPRAMILAAGLGAVLATGVAWPWLSVRGLRGELMFDRPRVREGRPATARLVLRNRMPWAAWGLTVRDSDRAEGPSGGAACAGGWGVTESSWELIADLRGIYPRGTPSIASAFPFGIRRAARTLFVPKPLLVWPATFPVGPVPEAAGGRESEGVALRNRAGSAGDLLGVRPYRRGDSLRRIHWPQSARHDTLIVCELESRATPRVQVVLDVHPDAHAGAGPNGSLEWAIRVAASFAEDWLGQGADVGLVYGRRLIDAGGGTVAARRARILDALAVLTAEPGATLAEVLAGPECRSLDAGLRVVVATDRSTGGRGVRAGAAERFVLLKAGAFEDGRADGGLDDARPWCKPWIWIDDPDDVPGQVRRGWKEVAVE
jgi:uncharacterized protein (DUF58 family)